MKSYDSQFDSPLPVDAAADRIVRRYVRRRTNYRRRNRMVPYVISLNLTAMIDTVFNLLFLFIIISRFGALEGMLPAKLPARASQVAAAPTAELPRTPLRVRLVSGTSAGACRVTIDRFEETAFTLAELGSKLRAISGSGVGFDGDTPVHLLAADDIAWDHVVNAYNAAMTANFTKIYFAGAP